MKQNIDLKHALEDSHNSLEYEKNIKKEKEKK
jgi:hypothetical protein